MLSSLPGFRSEMAAPVITRHNQDLLSFILNPDMAVSDDYSTEDSEESDY